MEKKSMWFSKDRIFKYRLTFLLGLTGLTCQAQFDVKEYLGGASKDFELEIIREQQNYLGSENFNAPLFRELEFRVRQPDLQSDLDDFRLRISPTNPWERDASKKYASQIDENLRSDYLVTFSEILLNRYLLLIDFFQLTEKRKLIEEQLEELDKLYSAVGMSNESFSSILKLKQSKLELEIEKDQLIGELKEVGFLMTNSEGLLEMGELNMIDAETIMTYPEEYMDQNQTNIFIQNEMNELRLKELEYRVEWTQRFNNLGFIQSEFRPEEGTMMSERLGFQVGLLIPIFNPDRPELQERKLNLIGAKKQLLREQYAIAKNTFMINNNLKVVSGTYQKLDSTLQYLSGISIESLNDSRDIISLNEFKRETRLALISAYTDLLKGYIRLLSIRGLLVERPLINYLSPLKEQIEQ